MAIGKKLKLIYSDDDYEVYIIPNTGYSIKNLIVFDNGDLDCIIEVTKFGEELHLHNIIAIGGYVSKYTIELFDKIKEEVDPDEIFSA